MGNTNSKEDATTFEKVKNYISSLLRGSVSVANYGYSLWMLLAALPIFFLNLNGSHHSIFPMLSKYNIDLNTGVKLNINPTLHNVLTICGFFGIVHSAMIWPSVQMKIRKYLRLCSFNLIDSKWYKTIYALGSNLQCHYMMHFWQNIDQGRNLVLYTMPPVAAYSLYTIGYLLLVIGTFQIDHFHMFGMRDALGMSDNSFRFYNKNELITNGIYAICRQPMQIGWFLCFFSTPEMKIDHMVFAAAMSSYILYAIVGYEEPRSPKKFGVEKWENYCSSTPRFCPFLRPSFFKTALEKKNESKKE